MDAIIPKNKKIKFVSFIKSNFNKFSQREIAKRLKIGKTTINRWSKEIGLIHKKHTVNEKFFDMLNEESSYILGFIYADGNISWNTKKGYYSLTITASKKDKSHLEKIRKSLASTKPLLYSEKTKSYRLIVNSKNLCKKLMKFGLTPQKSLTIEFPKIPSTQLKHFIRGVIDGDGHVRYLDRKRSPYFEISISSGSLKFCKGLKLSIKENVGINTNIRKIGENTHILQYSCSRGKKLANYIYSKACFYLERKYIIYNKYVVGGNKK